MEVILHILGFCPDSVSHFDLIDLVLVFNQLPAYIQNFLISVKFFVEKMFLNISKNYKYKHYE